MLDIKFIIENLDIVQEGLQDDKLGLYIHIPFCDRKCDYCDFISYSMGVPAQHEFKEALFKEIDMYRTKCEKMVFNSIYIGGGTPSVIYEGFIYELTRKLYSTFHFEGEIEFTVEINPNSITSKKLMEYLRSGVNRISVGVQCLDSKTLANVGRIQSMNNIENTFVTPVFNGSTDLRNAAGHLIEEIVADAHNKKKANDAYFEELFNETTSLYRLDQISTAEGKADLGPLPDTAVALLASLVLVWLGIGIYVTAEAVKKKKVTEP